MDRIGHIMEKKTTLKSLHEHALNSFGLKSKPNIKDKLVLPIEASVIIFVEDGSNL